MQTFGEIDHSFRKLLGIISSVAKSPHRFNQWSLLVRAIEIVGCTQNSHSNDHIKLSSRNQQTSRSEVSSKQSLKALRIIANVMLIPPLELFILVIIVTQQTVSGIQGKSKLKDNVQNVNVGSWILVSYITLTVQILQEKCRSGHYAR